MSRVVISTHAAKRYQQRVDNSVSLTEGLSALGQMASLAKSRSVPRHWMRGDVKPTAGLRFLVWSGRPDVCLLVRNGVVVTIVTRAMCASSPKRHLAAVGDERRRPMAAEVARWRWGGMIDEEAA